MFALYN